MWFGFGVTTLIIVVIYLALVRYRGQWRGELCGEGLRYECKVSQFKDDPPSVTIGVTTRQGLDFVLKRETWIDDFFKNIGLSREFQLGRSVFDKEIYIESDDIRFCRTLSLNRNLQADILAAFAAVQNPGGTIYSMRCNNGRLWINFHMPPKATESDVSAFKEVLPPILRRIADALESAIQNGPGVADPFIIRAIIFLAISTGLAVTGGLLLFFRGMSYLPFTLDWHRLWGMAGVLGVGLIALMVVLVLRLLGRSARTHLVLLELLLVGTFGATTSTFVALSEINMSQDRQPAVLHHLIVREKQEVRGRRGGKSYYLLTEDLSEQMKQRRFAVPYDLYHRVANKDGLRMSVKPGFLGLRWVEYLEPAK